MKHLRNEKWQHRLFLCLVLCMCTILLSGAQDISRELRQRPIQLEQIQQETELWTRQLLSETDIATTVAPEITLAQSLFLLKACSEPFRKVKVDMIE